MRLDDTLLTAFAQNGSLRLRCTSALLSLEQEPSLRILVEAGQSTLLCAKNTRDALEQHARQQALLDRLQSVAVFQSLKPSTNHANNVVADHSRHIIRDLTLLELPQDHLSGYGVSTPLSYAAVPIRSATGQLLGIYCVLDNQIRHDFFDQHTYNTLNDIATAISRHLASQLESHHDRKAKIALSSFLEHNRPQPARIVSSPTQLPRLLHPVTDSTHGTSSPATSTYSNSASVDRSLDGNISSVVTTPLTTPAEDCSKLGFFDPAPASLLRSTSSDTHHSIEAHGDYPTSDTRPSDQTLSIATGLIRAAHDLEGLVLLDTNFNTNNKIFDHIGDSTAEQVSLCETIEMSITTNDSAPARITPSVSIEHETLDHLISHFPQGCALKLDNDQVSILVVDTSVSGLAFYEKLDEAFVVTPDLHEILHKAQSLIFMPVWDSARQAFYAGMLGWPTNPLRVFTEQDLLSLSIYGRILTADISRLDAIDTKATKSDFVSSLSHELRSPLHGCLAAVEVLRDTELDNPQNDLLGMIESCASTLLYTLNHLLDFSRINDLDRLQPTNRRGSDGTMAPNLPRNKFGTVAEDYLCRVVQDTVEGIAYGHDREQAAYESDLSSSPQDQILRLDSNDLPSRDKDVAIFLYMESNAAWFSMVSAGAWKRLVMNLFGNSLKFCPHGHIEVTLKMVPDPKNADKRMAHLMVNDTEQCRHDFVELNYPLGPRAVARALHAALRMSADQPPPNDTTSNTLSSHDQADENPTTESVDKQKTTDPTKSPLENPTNDSIQTEHLLLVDDNAINLKLLSTFMKKLSISAHTAVDGEDAFSTYKNFASSQPFTTILMDISMPKMNGFESSRAIRDFEVENKLPRSRIIALTALGSEASRREAEASGINEYQMKPVAFKTLKGLFNIAPPVKIQTPQEAFAKM
ncbi:hypothetical protein E4T50_14814 [Aureobasidium sp. EXF-12298]|nr:hypothetical protein E4T50_14814 [Aureobasidium sp. EXF-12298]